MACNECGCDYKIVNKYFNLCFTCNKKRLSKGKEPKVYNLKQSILKARKPKKIKNKLSYDITKKETKELSKVERDEILYEKCFNKSNHRCEECNAPLPKKFRNADGKVEARFRYSHIIPKSIAPHLRWLTTNINILCLECHGKWENGDKGSMKIFKENVKKFPGYLS